MTFLGKLLVCFNFVLTLILVTMAVGLYTQRIDWSGKLDPSSLKPEADNLKVAKLKERLKPATGPGLYDDLNAAEARWTGAAKALEAVQPVPAINAEWYRKQLAFLEDSTAAAGVPVSDFEYDANGRLVFDKGFPKMVPMMDRTGKEPLFGVKEYQNQITVLKGSIADKNKEFTKLKNEDLQLTEEIAKPGGLAAQLLAEEYKLQQIGEEVDYLKPLWYNTLVEKALVMDRQKALESRKLQLEKAKGLVIR